jgi:hypothetical protein
MGSFRLLGSPGHALARVTRLSSLWLLVFLALPLASHAGDRTPLDLCRDAFTGQRERFEAKYGAPKSPGELLERLGIAGVLGLERAEKERSLELLRRAADLGHLPSRYHLATFSRGEGEAPLEGMLDPTAREQLIEELAEQTFPFAEEIMALRTNDEGFFPDDRFEPGFDAHAAAVKRWNYFRWMTRSALHGNRMAWESLAEFYALQIDEFESSPEDRVRGYAWEHLSHLPVHDWEKGSEAARWLERTGKQAAWQRLRGPDEQARAEALAAHYERSIFPHVLRDRDREAICAIEPQFADERIAARRIPDPVGPPPPPPPPPDPSARPPPPPPMPTAPDAISVVSRQLRPDRDVEIEAPLTLAEIPPGQAGVLERVICAVRDAPIFQQQGGYLSVQVYLKRTWGNVDNFVTLCSFLPRGAWMNDRPLVPDGVALRGGEVVTFSCRSFDEKKGRVRGDGCAVDVDLWVRSHARAGRP